MNIPFSFYQLQLHKEELMSLGHTFINLPLPPVVKEYCQNKNFNFLDQYLLKECSPKGLIFQTLSTFRTFSAIEHMLALRDETDEDDGIWHDDGSRLLAFSLSLTLQPEIIEGGILEIRPKVYDPYTGPAECPSSSSLFQIPTQTFGTLIVFQTGQGGFEHRIRRVQKGERLVAAGWCT